MSSTSSEPSNLSGQSGEPVNIRQELKAIEEAELAPTKVRFEFLDFLFEYTSLGTGQKRPQDCPPDQLLPYGSSSKQSDPPLWCHNQG